MSQRDVNPTSVAERLRADSAAAVEQSQMSSNQKVELTYQGGKFVLQWSASNIGSNDCVGLYRNITDPDSDYVASASAQKGTSYTTSQVVTAGYQARYLVRDSAADEYTSVTGTDPFPLLRVCSP